MTYAQKKWVDFAASEPERLDAQARIWKKQHANAGPALQFKLAMLIAGANRAASDLRAMRAARQRLSYSHTY